MNGVETRDPTADMDVISYLFRRSTGAISRRRDRSVADPPRHVGVASRNRADQPAEGLQAADWYEKLTARREQLAAEIAELSTSPLARRAIDLARLDRRIKNWPPVIGTRGQVYYEYALALPRAVAAARFLRWIEFGEPVSAGLRPLASVVRGVVHEQAVA